MRPGRGERGWAVILSPAGNSHQAAFSSAKCNESECESADPALTHLVPELLQVTCSPPPLRVIPTEFGAADLRRQPLDPANISISYDEMDLDTAGRTLARNTGIPTTDYIPDVHVRVELPRKISQEETWQLPQNTVSFRRKCNCGGLAVQYKRRLQSVTAAPDYEKISSPPPHHHMAEACRLTKFTRHKMIIKQ